MRSCGAGAGQNLLFALEFVYQHVSENDENQLFTGPSLGNIRLKLPGSFFVLHFCLSL
jgi:hypothetical protein